MNIYGIGTDLVDIKRFDKKLANPQFVDLIFTIKEIDYCLSRKNSAESFAARFAAKEAYMKALGSGWTKEANFKEIEIIKDNQGKPFIQLHGESKVHFEKSHLKEIFVSLSHTTASASAFVIITK
ncbi:holo-[acyl-carrier protein] synthase [Reichenbachiella faecimaris]|uniref:Holo-[acyl-carrier-protein] synthase n=1 Tax=Reichenbachiella faecimaris TaxID=692418 RepID=A0A1W2G6F0_REIFA|nr:holo-ACP synthase [Reichenbachiella faecimaris]SMD32193.1 holo-[acyl-carrier protein] synthase [Reichenbachiella faecimaris]